VLHYYSEPHPYFDTDVLIIGAKNSGRHRRAGVVATRLARDHVHRGPGIHQNVKYWIKPDIENRIKNAEVTAYFNSSVLEIKPDSVRIKTPKASAS